MQQNICFDGNCVVAMDNGTQKLVKDIMKKVILSYDFTDMRIDLFKIYNEIYNNNAIMSKFVEELTEEVESLEK